MSRQGVMLAYPLELSKLEKWIKQDGYVICQPKFNGDRGRILLDENVTMLSSEAIDRKFALPHIAEEVSRLKGCFHMDGIYELDGEFYCHGMEHEDIHSRCSRTRDLHPDHKSIKFYVFDHIVTGIPQSRRLDDLQPIFSKIHMEHLVLCRWALTSSVETTLAWYDEFIYAGFEGIIIRRHWAPYRAMYRNYMMKFKPSRSDIYTIVGLKEEIALDGTPKNRLGSFDLSDDDGVRFSVSAGLDDKDRERYWNLGKAMIGRKVKVYYQAKTKYGVPKFAIDLEVL